MNDFDTIAWHYEEWDTPQVYQAAKDYALRNGARFTEVAEALAQRWLELRAPHHEHVLAWHRTQL